MTPAQQQVWIAAYSAVLQALAAPAAESSSRVAHSSYGNVSESWERLRKRAAWEADAAVEAFNKANDRG